IVTCAAKYVIGSVLIRGEFYLRGDCEAHALGAGEIVDTGAFGDVQVGDRVLAIKFDGANGRPTDYALCTVDSIANAPDRIGTDSAKNINTTDWDYVIVRTEVSGSDDGTDGGTARNNCFSVNSVDKVTIQGFLMTFSDDDVVTYNNARKGAVYDCICEDCDDGISASSMSVLTSRYIYLGSTRYGFISYTLGYQDTRYSVVGTTHASYAAALAGRAAGLLLAFSYIFDGGKGMSSEDESWCYASSLVIDAAVTTGLYANMNSSVKKVNVTNNATTAESTSSGGVIA
ncbi:hypothetical protein ACFLXV_04485, partial [Chloroflexota bacterium]